MFPIHASRLLGIKIPCKVRRNRSGIHPSLVGHPLWDVELAMKWLAICRKSRKNRN